MSETLQVCQCNNINNKKCAELEPSPFCSATQEDRLKCKNLIYIFIYHVYMCVFVYNVVMQMLETCCAAVCGHIICAIFTLAVLPVSFFFLFFKLSQTAENTTSRHWRMHYMRDNDKFSSKLLTEQLLHHLDWAQQPSVAHEALHRWNS